MLAMKIEVITRGRVCAQYCTILHARLLADRKKERSKESGRSRGRNRSRERGRDRSREREHDRTHDRAKDKKDERFVYFPVLQIYFRYNVF